MADGLLNKASIILTPTGYKAGTLYNVAPVVEPYEDFDFARASVASRVNSSGLVEMVGRTLGSELVVNGDFSDGSNGWFVTNGNVTDKYHASMTAYQSGIKITPFDKTGTYRVTFDDSYPFVGLNIIRSTRKRWISFSIMLKRNIPNAKLLSGKVDPFYSLSYQR